MATFTCGRTRLSDDAKMSGRTTTTVQQGKHGTGVHQEEVSRALNEAGIPGIRFYDGSSRAKGEGTRNIVVFNPDDITQVKRDGEEVYNALTQDQRFAETVLKHDKQAGAKAAILNKNELAK